MKKIFGILSALLIIVCFTNEANAEVKQDNTEVVFEFSFEAIPTAIDNVVVVSSVENVVAFVTNYTEVGGSIVSSDANLPDQDNIVAISNSKLNWGLYLLSKRKTKRLLATSDNINSVTNDKVGDIVSNVGKYSTSS